MSRNIRQEDQNLIQVPGMDNKDQINRGFDGSGSGGVGLNNFAQVDDLNKARFSFETDLDDEDEYINKLKYYSQKSLLSPTPYNINSIPHTPTPTTVFQLENTFPVTSNKEPLSYRDSDMDIIPEETPTELKNKNNLDKNFNTYDYDDPELDRNERVRKARENTKLFLSEIRQTPATTPQLSEYEKKITLDHLIEHKKDPDDKPWAEMTGCEKFLSVSTGIWKSLAILCLLYFFVVSLDLLSLGFRLIGGRTASEIFKNSAILQNPIVGVMIGILTTVLVQSSSTSTSLVVSMVASGFVDVKVAIPIIMGCNIGTSITSTIVAFAQVGDREQFRRAFAGATILDMFNWVNVIVLLVVEILTGYLYHLSKAVMLGIMPDKQTGGEVQIITVITKPLVNLIVQLDKNVLECWSNPNCTEADDKSLIKEFCSGKNSKVSIYEKVVGIGGNTIVENTHLYNFDDPVKCKFLFAGTNLSDAAAGVIILICSLIILCTCLLLIVKVLSSVLEGNISKVIQRVLNAKIPYVPWITGYIAILIGAVMTFLVQSSSVFTSSLTPLVGLDIISLERMYPLGLGSNIGTTTTALLASLASEGDLFFPAMQIALCHFFFNLTGILLFYPIPFMRFPVTMARFMGNTTAKYRWFAVMYMVVMFALVPVIFIGLSFAGSAFVIALTSIVGLIILLVAILTIIQRKKPQILPTKLQDWKFLPLPLRSLAPYDKLLSRCNCRCSPCCKKKVDANSIDGENNHYQRDPYSTEPFEFFPVSGEMRASNISLDRLSRFSITSNDKNNPEESRDK